MAGHWNLHLTGHMGTQYIEYDGKPYLTARDITIETTQDEGVAMTMTSYLDDEIVIEGKLLPTLGLPAEPVDFTLKFKGDNGVFCEIAGTLQIVYGAKAFANATEPTRVEFITLVGNVPTRIEGVMLP